MDQVLQRELVLGDHWTLGCCFLWNWFDGEDHPFSMQHGLRNLSWSFIEVYCFWTISMFCPVFPEDSISDRE